MSQTMNTRNASKKEWTAEPTLTAIAMGSQQRTADALERIASASEAMAKNYTDLLKENEQLKQRNQYLSSRVDHLFRRIAAQQGVTTRKKKEIEQLHMRVLELETRNEALKMPNRTAP